MSSGAEKTIIEDQMLSTILGQAVGDAVGLMTEFMTKEECIEAYGKKPKMLLYSQMVDDPHRERWQNGDWTDDTDHAILIMQSLLYNKGQVVRTDFASRVHRWMNVGYPELGDKRGGMGIGATTSLVLHQANYTSMPHEAACKVWENKYRKIAPNGAVMRTCVLGLHQWQTVEDVVTNCLEICKCTHYDPRCQASCVAVSVAVALLLQHAANEEETGRTKQARPVDIDTVIQGAYQEACKVLSTEEEKAELWTYMSCTKLKHLELDEAGKIGYTYKCMGAGFWALKQRDFKKAIIKVLMSGGDADTNSAVAGALLGCKLGHSAIPRPWIDGLVNKDWLMEYFDKFCILQREMSLPIEQRSSHKDLDIEPMLEADKDREKERVEKHRKEFEDKVKVEGQK